MVTHYRFTTFYKTCTAPSQYSTFVAFQFSPSEENQLLCTVNLGKMSSIEMKYKRIDLCT